MKKPSVELRLPILPNMELIATQTAEDGQLLEDKLQELQALLPHIFPQLAG